MSATDYLFFLKQV